jgi:hypothetical protein
MSVALVGCSWFHGLPAASTNFHQAEFFRSRLVLASVHKQGPSPAAQATTAYKAHLSSGLGKGLWPRNGFLRVINSVDYIGVEVYYTAVIGCICDGIC